ncbi:rhodanese-like domain-containing protein [Niabella yanshanensis]|uniref:Rhodanese-like domain-containing protein n=1 Tax=Niabella yanshanensis TaxID=577386 RepID=A0ABZ0W4S2_9BACT|nr:rhodanese-like domain-containing protein [Niabella yanshanensis]WQD38181.1 rhodanese-like domain-containing protein [Niabella yanshanensis]
MITVLLLALVIALVYAGYCLYRSAHLSEELQSTIAEGALILDVRTEKEYAAGHINGAANISLGTIRKRYKELDPQKAYITYCSHGLRSVKAANLLRERGFKQVYNGGAREDLEKLMKPH